MRFTIPGKLPSLNDYIHAMNHNRYAGAKLKRDTQHFIAAYALGVKAVSGKVDVHIAWYEPNRRRDIDNVQSGTKFILDTLVAIGKLPDDSPRHVASVTHANHVDKDNPRVEVTLTCPNPNCRGGEVLDPQVGTVHPCPICEGGTR